MNVNQNNACPQCNEKNMDKLAISEAGDFVSCQSCGNVYRTPTMQATYLSWNEDDRRDSDAAMNESK